MTRAEIWVDADACPNPIKQILYRAAERTGIQVTFIANHFLAVPPIPSLRALQVAAGYDVADNEIVRRVQAGDLVISSDIPLANDAIDKGAAVLSPRGELLTKENIKGRLNMRDFLDTMRASGVQSGGPAPLGNADKQVFANQLDRYLAKWSKQL